MFWDYLKNIVKDNLGKPDKKEWFNKLVENLENQISKNINLPFRIVKLTYTGFVVKVSGLYAFIPFNYMPWKYNRDRYWSSVFTKLTNKTFFCKIHDIKKNPLKITINGEVPQFKKTKLFVGKSYRGIIIERRTSRRLVFVDIGYHFGWACGSFFGILHKRQFNSIQLYSSCSAGDEIEVLYQGVNEKGEFVFSQTGAIADWNEGIPQSLIGQTTWVQIVREGDKRKIKFLVNGKYRGVLIFSKDDHFSGNKKKAMEAMRNLNDGEIIHCEVMNYCDNNRTLGLRCPIESGAEVVPM